MVSQRDIYATAQLLIKRHGAKAEEHAERMMRRFMDKEDMAGAGVWLSIGAAIEDLRNVEQRGKLH